MTSPWLNSLSEDWKSPQSSIESPGTSVFHSDPCNYESQSESRRIPKNEIDNTDISSISPIGKRNSYQKNNSSSNQSSEYSEKLLHITNHNGSGHFRSQPSSINSTQYDTINYKKCSGLKSNSAQETLEWKKGLQEVEYVYDKPRDLFSAPNLEIIFQEPPTTNKKKPKSAAHNECNSQLESKPSTIPHIPHMKRDEKNISTGLNRKDLLSRSPESFYDVSNTISKSSSGSDNMNIKINELGQEGEITVNRSTSLAPSENFNKHEIGGIRTASGQSISRNEQLSQIVLVKQKTEDGRISFTPTDSSFDKIRKKKAQIEEEKPGHRYEKQEVISNTSDENLSVNYCDITKERPLGKIQRTHYPHGLVAKNEQFLRSQTLSDESALLPEESVQASTPKDLSNGKIAHASENRESKKTVPLIETTPHTSPSKLKENNRKTNSHSPLKIFDEHDTFTNDKLLRRLSQFEGELEGSNRGFPASYATQKSNEIEPSKASEVAVNKSRNRSRRLSIEKKCSIFGFEDLNNFQSQKKAPQIPLMFESPTSDKENITHSAPVSEKDSTKYSNTPLTVERNELFYRNTDQTNTVRQINGFREISQPILSPPSSKISLGSKQEEINTPRKRNGNSDGKRLPKTPLSHSDFKRRRTLYTKETEGESKFDSLKRIREEIQLVVKEKQETSKQSRDPQMIKIKSHPIRLKQKNSTRQNIQPKKPFTLGTSLDLTKDGQDFLNLTLHHRLSEVPGLNFTDNFSHEQIQSGSRKTSVTTNDFINEAKKIMANIRGQDRSRNALSSVEESESRDKIVISDDITTSEDISDDFHQESTLEPFSRPPSREGAEPVRQLPKKQVDPAILNHLRKYDENIDLQNVLASSQKSIVGARETMEFAEKIQRLTEEKILETSNRRSAILTDFVKSCSGIADISREKEAHLLTSNTTCESITKTEDQFQLLSNSIPTGISKESDHRRVIAPESVSHLIPERVAGMVFVREQNTWIRKKSLSGEICNSKSFTPEVTEDDPFGDIPDLSIDETLEKERIQAEASKKKDNTFISSQNSLNNDELHIKIQSQNETARNITEESENISVENTILMNNNNPKIKKIMNLDFKSKTDISEYIEKEISINDHRIHQRQTPKNNLKRNVTISFSSPIASFIETQEYQDQKSVYNDKVPVSNFNINLNRSSTTRKPCSREGNNSGQCAASDLISSMATPIRSSIGGHHFASRPVSRIEERNESSENNFGDKQINRSFSFVLTKSVAPTHMSKIHTTPRPLHEIGTLTLTPLSDFTVNHVDQSLGLDVSCIAQNQIFEVKNAKKTLSSIVRELVEKITEVEPYEPYWEHLKEMSLKGKQLKSVHKLDNFCERLKDLDISHNQISHLDGVPGTVQNIRINNNCLSDMTAWGHLTNLQYIDVSNNNLESLSSLKCLFHLRSLRADNNRITSLDGIDQLNGLLVLRMRNNHVRNLNFQKTKLQLLVDLDLRNNQVCTLENIHQLSSLSHLDLVDNNLVEFSIKSPNIMKSMKYLRLSGNKLELISIGCFPNLRLLYLDRNRLGSVTGILKTKYLDSLSLREQFGTTTLDPNIITEAFEVRKLFLSGNFLSRLQIESDFLNLQYLEMANCGIESLPEGFGSMLANVRVMNLNFNALSNIQQISGILRLKKLYLAGNRLTGLDGLVKLLPQVPTLSTIDLRGNPLTMGFHSPILMSGATSHEGVGSGELGGVESQYTLGKIDKIKDSLYVSCLDMRTRMKRRIYEINLIRSAFRLKVLDGLPIDPTVLLAKDKVYDCMVEAGFVAQSQTGIKPPRMNVRKETDTIETSHETNNGEIWQAEDSFG
ncbi:putative wd repeat domain-containing protein [Erysiphe neolycopersici]|uniref:Putative wd repeat domain-containing protein n=1 Tax=Erysiphe neolycopersici TaxID=212602 RepID=A0A420HL46_9PEZI|nr:putative wd repeat domain-containing protein [Erysiphe neolycopersici]